MTAREKMPTEEVCGVRILHEKRIQKARQQRFPERTSDAMVYIFKALGDGTRLKLLSALLGGEMCVCDLAAFLGVSESAVSHQLRRLRELGLVKPRRQGQVLFYSLDDHHVSQLIEICKEHAEHKEETT